jgi:hypothetical protein
VQFEQGCDIYAFNVFHHDGRRSIEFGKVEHLHDVGVLKESQQSGFVALAGNNFRGLGRRIAHHFDRNTSRKSVATAKGGPPNGPEAPLTQGPDELKFAGWSH